MKAKIASSLSELAVPIDSLHPSDLNPKRGNVERIAASLKRFGQVRPVLALPSGEIVAGAHTWRAAKSLGWDIVAANKQRMSAARAREYRLADNKLAELGDYDLSILTAELEAVAEADPEALELVGYSADELDALMDELGGGNGDGKERAGLLAVADVTVGEPTHKVEHGETYKLGERHRLVIADVFTEWPLYGPALEGGAWFMPFPTPHVPLSDKAGKHPMVFVTPDPYAAGHLLDKWAAVKGDDTIERL